MTVADPLARTMTILGGIFDTLTALGVPGFEARMTNTRSYRTEPIEGAELGGRPRNPEDDVVDEIDRLVSWQLEEGKR